MKSIILSGLIILKISLIDAIAIPNSPSSTISTGEELNVKRDAFPGLPGTAFTNNNAMEAAQAAAPIFLYSKDSGKEACYPESAIKLGSNPPEKNPGTDGDLGPAGIWPGADCTDPGPYHGAYSKGNPFPLYVTAKYCGSLKEWRVTYSVYYVHDGVMSEGHRHDWESATVVWTDRNDNLWQRNALILSQHSGHARFGWGDINSVSGENDVRDESTGAYKAHPKVYVGFFKHPGFPNRDTHLLTLDLTPAQRGSEYRSNDWYYIPNSGDLQPGSVIGDWNAPGNRWNYGDANSSPFNINGGKNGAKDICAFAGRGDDV